MELHISVDENGKLDVKLSKGVTTLDALGMLEIAKHLILSGSHDAKESKS